MADKKPAAKPAAKPAKPNKFVYEPGDIVITKPGKGK